MNINKLSQELLLAVKMNEPLEDLLILIADLDLGELKNQLKNDTNKKAFWINIYNAFFQILRKNKKIKKPKIYKRKLLHIAGKQFSLDDIEHGILRKYRYKFSLGYLPNIFCARLIKEIAVNTIDYRIHFALNCGAKSCPPIAFYSPDKLDGQLDMATISFLESETNIDHNKKEIQITRIFKWFVGDFGGKSGIHRILHKHLSIKNQEYKLIFKEFSKEEALSNYVSVNFS